jgi:hypothetical protein
MDEDRPQHGRFIMIYSDAGEGKTTLAAQFEKPLFIATNGEQGIHIHKQNGVVDRTIPIIDLPGPYMSDAIPDGSGHPGYVKALNVLKTFAAGKHDRKTVVLDSMSGFELLLIQHCASLLYGGDINGKDFTSFWVGHTDAVTKFFIPEFIRVCLDIVAKGYNVVLLSHSTVRDFKNPTGNDYPRYQPALYTRLFEALKKDLHAVFFMGRSVNVQPDKKKNVKASSETRFVALAPSCYYVAKCWSNKPGTEEIECGSTAAETYNTLMNALV